MPILSDILNVVRKRREKLLLPSQVATESDHALTPKRNLSLAMPTEDSPVVIITGRAGTGKSTLVRELARTTGTRQVVLAPTGVAALNIGGQTIHSFFRLPPHIIHPSAIVPLTERLQVFQNLERIVIDEMSMVRADLLDAIDVSLRVNRRSQLPFGGVKIILIGDLLQLPPVVPKEEDQILRDRGYETPYIISAEALQNLRVKFVEMGTVHRQKDEEFIQMLASLRVGEKIEQIVETINQRCLGPHHRPVTPIILTAANAQADSYNRDKLNALPGPTLTYEGFLQGNFNLKQDKLPAPIHLELKVGARVVMVKNDANKRWVNGSLATITHTSPNAVTLLLDGKGQEVEVKREKWDRIEYKWNPAENRMTAEVVGSYSQIPVKLAWAMTIHKAQGLTLEDVRIDLGSGAFASGQAYVALSRVRSLDGLSLATRLTPADVRIDPTLLAVMEEIARRSTAWTECRPDGR